MFSIKKKAKSKYYTSIDDCPIAVFIKITKSSTLEPLCYEGKATKNELNEAWRNIYDGYLRLYGISNQYKEYVALKIEASEYFLESLQEGQIWKRSLYKLKDQNAESLMKETDKTVEFEKVIAERSKVAGFRLDANKITVREFYGYLNLKE